MNTPTMFNAAVSPSLALLLAVLILGLAVFFIVRKKKNSSKPEKTKPQEDNSGLNQAQNDLFNIGLHPAEDGITTMYALETCRHCRRTKEFLEDNKVDFHIIYVDQYTGSHREQLMAKVREFNPRGSFPTIMLPNGKIVVGYREQLMREALLNDQQ